MEPRREEANVMGYSQYGVYLRVNAVNSTSFSFQHRSR